MSTPQPPSNVSIRISAPGKVILHGEHSVVYDKLAFAASLGLRTRLEYSEEESQDGITFEFPAVNLLHFYRVEDINDLLAKPIPLVKSASSYNHTHPEMLNREELLQSINAFIKSKCGSLDPDPKQLQALTAFIYMFWAILGTMDVEMKRFKLRLSSELSVGAGTGSSASFGVTIAAFLLQFIRVKKCKSKSTYKSVKVGTTNLATFDKNELELISKWAFQAEKLIHGTPSGVDNTICTYGGLVEFRKGASPKLVEISTQFSIILINTKIPRDTKVLVSGVAAKREKLRSIVDGILELMDETTVKALDLIKKINRRMGDEFDVLEYYETLGELTDINQNLLRCLGVSHPRLDDACQILAESKLHGKLTGAGGGGYAVCLVPPYVDSGVVARVLEKLTSDGFAAVLTDLGGCGVSID